MLFQIIYFLLDHRFLYYYGPFVINNNIMITIWTDLIKSYYTFKVAVKFSVLLDAVYTSDFFFLSIYPHCTQLFFCWFF